MKSSQVRNWAQLLGDAQASLRHMTNLEMVRLQARGDRPPLL